MSKKKCGSCKRPPNAFILFCRETRPSIVQKFPKMVPSDVSSLLSQLWKSLDVLSKQAYKQQAQNLLLIANKEETFYDNTSNKIQNNIFNQTSNSDLSQSDSEKINSTSKSEPCHYYPMLDVNELFFQIVPEKNYHDLQEIFENIVGENDLMSHNGSEI